MTVLSIEWYLLLAIIGVGFIAGFINILAGSGSLLTLPLLIFLGLPANVANGTNRIAILLQNIVGIASFRQQNVMDFRKGLFLGIPAIVGSLLGSRLALNLNDEIMTRTIGGLLVLMFFMVFLKPDRWITGREGNPPVNRIFQILIFFLVGIYGGFIQAGVGFFLLAGLVLGTGYDLVKANALKILIVFLYTPFALAVFFFHHQVDIRIGLILALGNMAGAFVASRFAVKWGPKAVRYFLLVILAFASLKLLGVFQLEIPDSHSIGRI